MSFQDLGLSPDLLRAVGDAGYTNPTPIQEQSIPYVLMGRDILGCAQTGTGKTAAFTLPMIEILGNGRAKARMPRSLIITPTRELAAQISANFETYGKYHKLTMALLIGGVSFDEQIAKLDRGVDVLIATPGRLLDHFERGRILLTDIKILVIDEADRMMDMGFMPDVERIVGLLPKIRQTLFFSATMPPEIRRIADRFVMNPKEISVTPEVATAETVTQGLAVIAGEAKTKRAALRALIRNEDVANALIFCNRKRDVDVLNRSLQRHGFSSAALHGDMQQSIRQDTLDSFKKGEVTLLVASDVAARGLDMPRVSHVFNFDVPTHAEDYVHRIGRTGRAGRKGRAFTLAMAEDGKFLDSIQRYIGIEIPRVEIEGFDPAEPDSGSGRSRGGRRGSPRGSKESGGSRKSSGDRPRRSRQKAERPAETADERPARENVPAAETSEKPRQSEKPRERAEAATAEEPLQKAPARDTEKPRQKSSPENRDRSRRQDNDERVVGMGSHVPAFMQRSGR
ncbi:MAG: DEAD/DEAH box helicase [Alphaproteobacteria bacterium]|nr:DEAD/DEAH box helicase [Alphaproteobacteria bacterium]